MTAKSDPLIQIEDLADIRIGNSTTVKRYFQVLFYTLMNRTITYSDFNDLTIPKSLVRKMYMRAYPKAKV